MGKKAAKKTDPDSVVERVLSVLQSGEKQVTLILVVPSHDRKKKALPDQTMWANAAADLFAKLFGGGDSIPGVSGDLPD